MLRRISSPFPNHFRNELVEYSIDSYTKLLLHMNGIDDSTTFIDETGKTVVANNAVKIKTNQKKAGTASGFFIGASEPGDYLSIADSDDWNFGTEDFTIDFWMYWNDVRDSMIFGNGIRTELEGYPGNGISFQWNGLNQYNLYLESSAYYFTQSAPEANKWYHYAIVRNGDNLNIFINGEKIDSYISMPETPDDIQNGEGEFRVGVDVLGYHPISAYIDEFRVSKGIARWTSNFNVI